MTHRAPSTPIQNSALRVVPETPPLSLLHRVLIPLPPLSHPHPARSGVSALLISVSIYSCSSSFPLQGKAHGARFAQC